MQAKLENSAAGKAIISVLLLAIVGAIVVLNLPDSQLKNDLLKPTRPFVNATGLDQNWGIFSAPRTLSAYVIAQVYYADGSSSPVGIPADAGIGGYVDYRWQKYEEIIRPDDGRPYWHAYAEFVAAKVRKAGKNPVRVSLIRKFALTNPPGPGPQRGPWQQVVFYDLNLTAAS